MITVSIVAYKTSIEEMSKCLQSLTSPLVSTIYIVDNSNQKYIANFCMQYSNVVYIGSENVGYGAGHNKALRQVLRTQEKYHLVLNSDVYFEASVLDHLVGYMETNPDVAQVQPNVVSKRVLQRRYKLKFFFHSFMFFRLECFEKVGLFDERFFMYPEDIDITRRMHKYYRTMFIPDETIVHAHRAASYKSRKMLKIHITNMIKYFNKWGWIYDKERSVWNKQLLKELGYKK